MNFEQMGQPGPEKKGKEDARPTEEEAYEQHPGIGTHDVNMAKGEKGEDKIIRIGRGIKGGLEAGKIEEEEIPEQQESILDKLEPTELRLIEEEARRFAEKSPELIGLEIGEREEEFSKIMKEKAEELALKSLAKNK